jgi:hypothetical protein
MVFAKTAFPVSRLLRSVLSRLIASLQRLQIVNTALVPFLEIFLPAPRIFLFALNFFVLNFFLLVVHYFSPFVER